MKSGVELIAKERDRQIIEEGWDADHDDQHKSGELAMVAALYAAPEPLYYHTAILGPTHQIDGLVRVKHQFEDPWPATWARKWDKRTDPEHDTIHMRIVNLAKAGALCAAEIDRLSRIVELSERVGGDIR